MYSVIKMCHNLDLWDPINTLAITTYRHWCCQREKEKDRVTFIIWGLKWWISYHLYNFASSKKAFCHTLWAIVAKPIISLVIYESLERGKDTFKKIYIYSKRKRMKQTKSSAETWRSQCIDPKTGHWTDSAGTGRRCLRTAGAWVPARACQKLAVTLIYTEEPCCFLFQPKRPSRQTEKRQLYETEKGLESLSFMALAYLTTETFLRLSELLFLLCWSWEFKVR